MLVTVLAATIALTLPSDFDPDMNMRYKVRGGERIHEVKDAANLARRLVENGAPDDITLAVKVLDAVFFMAPKGNNVRFSCCCPRT